MTQALQAGIHEACIAMIAKSNHSGLDSIGPIVDRRHSRVITAASIAAGVLEIEKYTECA